MVVKEHEEGVAAYSMASIIFAPFFTEEGSTMFDHILVPVDLRHKDQMEKALTCAADLAKHYSADIHILGVTSAAPSEVAHNMSEFQEKLNAFAEEQSAAKGASFEAKAVVSHDPAIDLGEVLVDQTKAHNIDLVVMASHVPHIGDYILQSNAGHLASHTGASVFIVR